MSLPFYVSPEQQSKDRAEFARKGIQRGRSVVVISCAGGIAMVAENRSSTLRKLSEIYDRIGFAAVGRYNEFEALRIAGIRQADLRGYAYDRRDVTARALAGQYSQLLGAAFASQSEKPFEVELVVAELGADVASDVLFQISYDGTIADAPGVAVLGGDAERIAARFDESAAELSLIDSVRLARRVLTEESVLTGEQLEVAVLERGAGTRRTFRRVEGAVLDEWLGEPE